jgi:hypothetical protein
MKPILPKMEILNSAINFAKKCFTKPQFAHFRDYVGGLIALPTKSIKRIAGATVNQKDQSSLNRFLTSANWDEEELQSRYLKKIRHALGRERPSLILDDSLSKKTGQHIAEVQYHKDHSGGGYLFGHQIVTALVKLKGKALPLFPKLYSKKTCSKIEFAKQLITLADDKLHIKEAIMDSWYTATEIIKLCLKKSITVIGCIKSNRTVSFATGEWTKLSAYREKLKAKDFTLLVDDSTYRVHERIVRMKHVGFIKLLISQEWNATEKKWSRPFYLISTDTRKSAVQIIRTYSERWSIETFHRDIKQNLGFEAYMLRGRKGITRHLILVVLAYAALKFWMALQNVTLTIGEAIRHIQGKLFDDLIMTIVEEDNIEARWKLAEPFISRTAKA